MFNAISIIYLRINLIQHFYTTQQPQPKVIFMYGYKGGSLKARERETAHIFDLNNRNISRKKNGKEKQIKLVRQTFSKFIIITR